MPSDSGLASQERTIVNKVTVRFAGDSGDGMH